MAYNMVLDRARGYAWRLCISVSPDVNELWETTPYCKYCKVITHILLKIVNCPPEDINNHLLIIKKRNYIEKNYEKYHSLKKKIAGGKFKQIRDNFISKNHIFT